MKIDLNGRVKNTRLAHSNSLLPVFEAIVNSIHAIADAEEPDGRIDVYIRRDGAQQVFEPEDVSANPVLSFVVQDNGIGFTQQNFDSFDTSDSTQKASRGGKGIGRLLWLKAFQQAEVESVFEEGGQHLRRTFRFSLSEHGISNPELQKSEAKARLTQVTLLNYRNGYRDKCPRSTVNSMSCISQ